MRELKRSFLVGKIVPAFIFFVLWLDGSLLPLILLPILYVILVEKKRLSYLGFSQNSFRQSLVLGLVIAVILSGQYYLIFNYYLPNILNPKAINFYDVFTDIVHYPLYEEVAYRSFFLTHYAELDRHLLSTRNLAANCVQSLLFVAVHKHHFSTPLILIPVFLLAFLNGVNYLKTKNIYGCILAHSLLNSYALALR